MTVVTLPLRSRLTFASVAGMAAVLLSVGAFVFLQLRANTVASIDEGLRSRAEIISAGLDQGGFADAPGSLVEPSAAFAQVIDASGRVIESSQVVSGAPIVSDAQLRAVSAPTFVDRRVPGLGVPARLLIVPVGSGQTLVVGASLVDLQESLTRLLVLLAIGGGAALVAASGVGWLLAGAALRPVERMRAEVAAISASEPERRLRTPGTGDELQRLATTLNDMLERLQQALQRERSFVDQASHELRTPLGVLRTELELATTRDRSRDELREAIRRSASEADHVIALAEDLLVLARSGRGLLPVHPMPLDLEAALRSIVGGWTDRAASAGVTVSVDAPNVLVSLDERRLRQAIGNLLDNALRYAPGGRVWVVATLDGDVVRIVVEDNGPGFPAMIAERVFQPFVRGHGTTGPAGVGLGLSIVRAVAASHGGRATARDRIGGGARVEVTLRSQPGAAGRSPDGSDALSSTPPVDRSGSKI